MKQITLRVSDNKYALLLEFLKSLTYVEVEMQEMQILKTLDKASEERQKMLDFINNYQNDNPSFGDALTWQRLERTDRELPH